VNQNRIAVVPNAVREPAADWVPPRFAQVAAGRKRIFVTVGRLSREKGVDLAMLSFQQVASQVPDARLLIIGEGPLRDELIALRSRLALDDVVDFGAPVTDLSAVWKVAYALLFTSRSEGFPNVLADAMAHGVPPVAFDCATGPADLVEDGWNGFLVERGDTETAAARCVELIRNPVERDLMGQRAMAVSERYSVARIGQLWCSLVERIRKDQVRGNLRYE
jgi:glycosyltransferase involved in cell wall biosynthesis